MALASQFIACSGSTHNRSHLAGLLRSLGNASLVSMNRRLRKFVLSRDGSLPFTACNGDVDFLRLLVTAN
jgi:hypothetical protein